ncbi:MAG: anthranilate phosphoribosyltransferase [Planctomycetota bacterium]|jgi:anthranilate synthase/phosphoribosyltransferase|nr:anthranilate phosphoribosyltransferase [Planctomycetota bacterium]
MRLIVDHFDSFTYNLAQMLGEITSERMKILRYGSFRPEDLEELSLDGIVFSPGPGLPEEYPDSLEVIRRFLGRVPLLGVCLGHELLAAALGGKVRRARRIMHGKSDEMLHDGRGCFRNIPSPASFVRYHSLVADSDLPPCFEAAAWSRQDGDVMALRHREFQAEGFQFHPESVGSEYGRRVLENFINYRREPFPARKTLSRLLAGENLERETARAFMLEMAEGNLGDAQLAGFLCALEAKGVTADEIAGCASVMADKCAGFEAPFPVLDIVGIGGDGKGTFNLSSMASLAAAACGQAVAKHGNRAVSSFCGSADFFAEIGYPLNLPPRQAERLLAETGFAFLFAPLYHGAMKNAAKARRELSIRTLMNLLGPLANPARAEYQLLGAPEGFMLRPLAEAALLLGAKRVMTVRSEDGLDEFSCAAPTRCVLGEADGELREFIFRPAEAGIGKRDFSSLRGGTAEDNVALARRLLAGEEIGGLLDAVCLNAGAGLFVAGRVDGLAAGTALARQAFAGGVVAAKLEEIIRRAGQLAA